MLSIRLLFVVFAVLLSATSSVLFADEVHCDVVVVGGGAAGVPAAIQSGKAGAKTVLLEVCGQLGGTTTTGGVNFPGLFHAWGKQVIAGIGWDLVRKAAELNDDTLPDFTVPTGKSHWKHQIKLNAPLFSLLAEEACLEAGVDVRYFETPIRIEKKNGAYEILTSAYGESRTIHCKQLVDCTGNASVAHMLGFERLREETRQPGSYYYRLNTGISAATFKEKKSDYEKAYKEALATGKLQKTDLRWGLESLVVRGGELGNYVSNADSSTAKLRTDTNQRGRASLLRSLRFVRSLPGGEKAKLVEVAPEVGVRETWRIGAEYMITQDDYVSGKVFPDSLCYAFYPIDMHTEKSGVRPAHLKEGIVATVPLRALIPSGSENLLVAGRCIGSDRGANSALRVQATCMATGQVAGAAAALAAKENVSPGKLDVDKIKKVLKENDAVVP